LAWLSLQAVENCIQSRKRKRANKNYKMIRRKLLPGMELHDSSNKWCSAIDNKPTIYILKARKRIEKLFFEGLTK